MSLSPGTRLDHYEILSPPGKGGMGRGISRARHEAGKGSRHQDIASRSRPCGAQDEALDWLENATRRGFVHYPLLSRSRTFRSLHGNSRFEQSSAGVKTTWEEMQRLPL